MNLCRDADLLHPEFMSDIHQQFLSERPL